MSGDSIRIVADETSYYMRGEGFSGEEIAREISRKQGIEW